MSLYDDYKKSKGKPANDEQKVKNTDEEKVVETSDSNVAIGDEVYNIVKDPFYKKKEFYLLCLGVLVAIVILFLLLYTPKFEMEDLSGKDEEYAKTYSETYDLNLTVSTEFSDEYEKNKIFLQSLAAGEEHKEGSVLQVTISKGPDYDIKVQYPDFSTMTYEEALTWKEENHAVGTDIIEEYSDEIAKGAYIKEELGDGVNKADFKRSSGTKIYFSKGKQEEGNIVSVPNFKSKPIAEAAMWAKENNITLNVTEVFDEYLTPQVIFEQSILAGEKIEKGGTLTVTISVGEGVTVPSFIGTTAETSANVAAGNGATIGAVTQRYSSSVPKGSLISQSYGAGVTIKQTDAIDLVYSLGKVSIGNYVGMSEPDVVATIDEMNAKGANITLHIVDWNLSSAPPGTVEGTVASHDIVNDLVGTGAVLTVAVYR